MRTQDFETKNLGERHDFYGQGYTLILANLFENFRNMCLKIYKLDPEKFLSAPGLAWQAAFKKAKVNLEWIKDNSKFHKDLIKNYDEERNKRCFLEVNVQYIERLYELHNDSPFLPGITKIERVKKLVAKSHDKTEYVVHIRNLKQTLNHGLVLKKSHKVITFNQNAGLTPYIDMNANLKKSKK